MLCGELCLVYDCVYLFFYFSGVSVEDFVLIDVVIYMEWGVNFVMNVMVIDIFCDEKKVLIFEG